MDKRFFKNAFSTQQQLQSNDYKLSETGSSEGKDLVLNQITSHIIVSDLPLNNNIEQIPNIKKKSSRLYLDMKFP